LVEFLVSNHFIPKPGKPLAVPLPASYPYTHFDAQSIRLLFPID
jgi:hypothetical protein